ncbi:MAG: hypothetical protein NC132_04265 [Corallococcus sp.]|nr:hypothetical protein [Corallococcus sp.]MCM1359874.1 hypothetical protein [Corallococcus sp.]MCM1395308.1 hypothetical protein [Corallococcus sp.]
MMVLDENVGDILKKAFASNHAAHAYIVVGDKHQLYYLLKQCAAACMCKSHVYDGCEICNKIDLGIHQDVITFPRDTEKGRLTVADMVTLVDECYRRPVDSGDVRVFLVDASNSVAGIGAEVWQNKLLKTLEEPTENVYIFIGVTDAESLLPTVRSRCQVLKQTKLSAESVCQALIAEGFERRFCEIAAAGSGGSIESGKRIMSDASIFSAFDNACDMAQNMTSTKNALNFVSQVLANKEYVSWFLFYLAALLRESVVYRLADGLCLFPCHEREIKNICQNYTVKAAEACIEIIDSAKRRLDDGGNLTVVVDQLASSILEVRYRCRI